MAGGGPVIVNVPAQSIGRGGQVDFKCIKPPTAPGKEFKYWGSTDDVDAH